LSGAHLLVLAAGLWAAIGAHLVTGRAFTTSLEWALYRLEAVRPPDRELHLWVWAALPWMFALGVPASIFLPSGLDWLGLLRDHCHGHAAGAPHLCFQHASLPPDAGGTALVLAGAGACLCQAKAAPRSRLSSSILARA